MKLSVIIVSFNVRYFLEKCIVSVLKALENIEGEVIVIDNQSSDNSAEMVRTRFPQVHLITNTDNKGFAKACNQGLRISQAQYALLLNPDTLVSEETFHRCLDFMDTHSEASACGVRMVDGTGTFLPESMRGLPSPLSAFFKMTGMWTVFPRSRFFNGYYMGGLDPEQVHEVPVLTGAFMFIRMSALDKIGLLDEDYFMYGEDIDLCYRMVQAGYRNYYLPEPSIIHYKGESTHRGSLRYIRHFYEAMMIYVSKHIHGAGGGIFKVMIMLAVVLRGLLGGVKRVISSILPLFIDAVVIVGILLLVKTYWAQWYFHEIKHFDRGFYLINLPLYSLFWLLALFFAGAHDIQRNARRIFYGMCIGTIAILVIYAMLPLQYRSSRAVILISAITITVLLVLLDTLRKYIANTLRTARRVAIVGSGREVRRIMDIMNRVEEERTIVGWITTKDTDEVHTMLGNITQLGEIVQQQRIDELIFSAQDLSFQEINSWMTRLGPSIAYRISSSGSDQIVGSDSKKAQGSLYTANVELALAYPNVRRSKRLLDIFVSVLLMCIWPFFALIRKDAGVRLRNIISVFLGKKTWIGYNSGDQSIAELPSLRPGVLTTGNKSTPLMTHAEIHMINYIYAREYTVWKDIDLLLKNITQIC